MTVTPLFYILIFNFQSKNTNFHKFYSQDECVSIIYIAMIMNNMIIFNDIIDHRQRIHELRKREIGKRNTVVIATFVVFLDKSNQKFKAIRSHVKEGTLVRKSR